MDDWLSEVDSDNIYPKPGQSKNLVVADIKRISNKPEFEPKKKDGPAQGWFIEITDAKGRTLPVNSFVLQRRVIEAAHKDRDNPNGPLVGRQITIDHPSKGDWRITVGPMDNEVNE